MTERGRPTARIGPLCPPVDLPPRIPVKFFVLLLLTAISGAVSVAVASTLVRPDLMLVERVTVVGASHAGEAEIRHLLDVPNGTRMWEIDADALQERVELHPWVRAADVSVRWPDTVVVEVTEREVFAVVHADAMLLVDRDGTPFLPAGPADLDHTHITGLGGEVQHLHPELPGRVLADAFWLLDQLHTRGLATQPISEIQFSAARGFTVFHGPSRVVFGHGDLTRQLDRLEVLTRDQGVSLDAPTLVDLAPASVAIVRPLRPTVARPSVSTQGS